MSDNKVDLVVDQMIDSVRKKGRGFVLGLAREADGDRVSIEVKETLPPVDDHVGLAPGRCHEIADTESLIAYAGAYGDKKMSLIMVSDESVTLTIDEMIATGEREIVSMGFSRSTEWGVYSVILGRPCKHRDLYQFFAANSHTLRDATILESMRTMKMNTEVKHDSDLQEDSKSIGVLVTSKAGEELKRFPKEIPIRLPVLDQDAANDQKWVELNLKLVIDLPVRPGEPPLFSLLCPLWQTRLRQRIRHESEVIAEALSEYHVIRGKHRTFPRVVGRGKTIEDVDVEER